MKLSLVDLDETNLHTACFQQDKLVMEFGSRLAEAKKRHSEAKANLDAVMAELELDIRQDPAEYNLEKATESSVKAAVIVHPKFKRATTALIQAKYEMDQLAVIMDVLEHRKHAIESAVKLFGQQYFSAIKLDSVSREVVEEETKQRTKKKGTRR